MKFFRNWGTKRNLRKGGQLEEQGRFEEALAMYESALAQQEGTERVHALSHAGLCSLALGKPAEARRFLEEVTKLAPEDATGWLNYGRVRQELADSVGANEAFKKANELSPDRPDILYHMATNDAEKYTRAALEAAKRALNVTIKFLEKPGGTAQLQALGFPAELPIVLIRNIALDRGDAADCAQFLLEVALRKPGESTKWVPPAAYNHRGLILANIGEYDAGAQSFRLALEADDTIDPAHFNLAMVLARLQKWDEAEVELKMYAERHKGSPVVAYGWATIEEMKGNVDEAVRHFRGTLERFEAAPVSPAGLARLDVPRGWLEQTRRFLAKVTGEGAAGEGDQWTGPGKTPGV